MSSGPGGKAALIAVALLAVCCKGADNASGSSAAPPREVSLDEAPSARRVIESMSRFQLNSAPLVPSSSAVGFIASGDRVRAVIPSAERARSLGPVDVELPRHASGDVWIKDLRSGMGVRFRDSEAGTTEIATADGLAVFGASGTKKSSLYRVHAEGVEDYVLFEHAPSAPELRYEIDVSGVAGIRLVSDALELLDRDGAPRLRVGRPFLVDADGERHEARLKLEGCAYDENPRMPWGRPVTPPGASHCALRVSWAASAVRYPAVLDPVWTSTCSMSVATSHHQTLRLKDGRVLVVRTGWDSDINPPFGDIYDPKSGTWAVTQRHAAYSPLPAVVLADGRVLTSRALYNPVTGQLTVPSGSHYGEDPEAHSLTALDNGKAVAFGGYWSAGFEELLVAGGKGIFDPLTNEWSVRYVSRGATPGAFQGGFSAAGHAAVKLADGRVLLAGGEFRSGNPADCYYPSLLAHRFEVYSIAQAAIYDPATDSIAAIASMTEPRLEPQGVLLANGKILIVGPWRCERRDCPIMGCDIKRNESAAEIYDPATNTWTPVGASDLADVPPSYPEISGIPAGSAWTYGRHLDPVPLVSLPDGNVLRAGAAPSLFAGDTGRWFAVADYREPSRRGASATLLETGKVLVAGGMVRKPPAYGSFPTSSAELYEGGRLGTACAASHECVTGHCVDGVCCDSACTGLCQACSSAKKGPLTVEGHCGPIKKGNDPDSECHPIGTGACETSGTCNGAGACLTRAGEVLGPKSCDGFLGTAPYESVVYDSCNEQGEPARVITTCYPGSCSGGANGAECTLRCGVCPTGECSPWWGLCGEFYHPPPRDPPIPPGTKSNGVSCNGHNECASAYCIEGVCCDKGCASPAFHCYSCLAALKAEGPDGVCGPVKEGTDPYGACPVTTDCRSGGLCGANGQCAPKPAGSPCGEIICQDTSTYSGMVCDQNAQCVQGTGSCGAYACGNNVCKFCCASNADCAPGFECRECKCVGSLPIGQQCTSADQCQSGFCADGRCCDTACNGQCESCDLAGSEGTCGAVSGAPRGARAACADASGSPCAGSCNGVERGACSYPSSSTECAPAVCAAGSVTTSSCDGQGTCTTGTTSCKGYACDGSQCRNTCTLDSDCAPGNRCNGNICAPTSDGGDAGETPPDGDGGDPGDAGDASSDSPSESDGASDSPSDKPSSHDGSDASEIPPDGGSGNPGETGDASSDSSSGSGGAGGSRPHKPPPDDGCSLALRKPSGGRWLGFVALAAVLGAMGVRRRRRGSHSDSSAADIA